MESFTEDSDEDYLDDPITLLDFEQKRINVINSTLRQESIVISDSDVDYDTVPSPQPVKSTKLPKSARASYKTVSSKPPEAFIKKSRNIEHLNKLCLPLRIKVVDCNHNSWYYRKIYKNIKFEGFNKIRDLSNKNKKEYTISVEGRNSEDTMKLKIRPVNVENYLKSIEDTKKTAQCKQNNDKRALKKGNDEKTVQFRNINFKKNKGLVGLKIVYDVNVTDSNTICEGNKQLNEAKIPKCDSQNMENKSIETMKSPKNSQKKRNNEESLPLVDLLRPLQLKKNNHGAKSYTSNSDSLKFTSSSKAAEEKQYHKKKSSQTHISVASKKDISKKKCSEQKTKPKTSGKEQKVLKETKEVENAKIYEKKDANFKGTENFTAQKNETKGINGQKRMAEKVNESKGVLEHTLDIDLNNENDQKFSVDYNAPDSIIAKDKVKPEKHKIMKPIQQNIDERCEQKQNNPTSSNVIGKTMDIKDTVSKKKTALKIYEEYNVPVSNLTKSKVKPIKHKATKKIQLNNDGRCEQQKNPQKNEKCTGKFFGQKVNKGGNMKTESKFVSLNEGNTDKKMENNTSLKRSQMPPKVANNQLNDFALKMPDLSKQGKSSEFQQKQDLSNHNLIIGKSEHLQIKQALAPIQKVVIYPVSNIITVAENSPSTSNPAAQEKRSMCNEKMMSSHDGLLNYKITVPTSVHQMLPSSNQGQIRYQISTNVPMSKVLPRSFSQPTQNKNLISTPNMPMSKLLSRSLSQSSQYKKKNLISTPPPNSKTPSILSHARIIIKRPNSEPVSYPGQQQPEKQNDQNNSAPNKTLNLIPTLTSTSKGRYLLLTKKIIDSNQVREQLNNSVSCNFEEQQPHTMPIQHNKLIQNQSSSQYSIPDMSSNTNNLARKEKSTNEPLVSNPPPLLPNLYSNRLEKNTTQYPNLQRQQPSVSPQNYSSHFTNMPPHSNLYESNYVQNPQLNTDQTQYVNEQSQLNKNLVPLSSQQPKQNEHRSFFNKDATLDTLQSSKTVQPALPTWQNKHASYYNPSSCQAHQQQKLNEHATWSPQNTILNLDTNALMQPPPLYDYSQSVDDMDCAYWNDVNYLDNEWQEGYLQSALPAESQQLPPVFQHPPGLSDYRHPQSLHVSHFSPGPQGFQNPPSLPVSQYPSGPPDFQHPTPLPILHQPPTHTATYYPPPSSIPQQSLPPSVAHNPISTAALEYPPPTPVTQHPPPVITQHPPPPLPSPHPPFPTKSTQGCTILGANNNGVVRTINLVTSTTTGPKVATLNSSLIAKNNNPVNSKTGMLKEASKITENKSPNLKRSISNFDSELNKFINRKACAPLAKVRKIEGIVTDPSSPQKSLNNGYSPPILPIFTYEKSFEHIAQVSKALDNAEKCNGQKLDLDGCVDKNKALKKIKLTNNVDKDKALKKTSTHEKNLECKARGSKALDNAEKCNSQKPDLGGCVDKDKALKKISINEYKNRPQEEKVEDIKTERKSESKLHDTDLGYDSDSTVVLV